MLVIVIIADGAKPKRASKPKAKRKPKPKAATVGDGLDVAAMNRRSKRF